MVNQKNFRYGRTDARVVSSINLVIYVHWTIWKVPMPQVSLTIRSWNSDLEIIYGCIWKISSNCQHFTFQWPWWKHLAKMKQRRNSLVYIVCSSLEHHSIVYISPSVSLIYLSWAYFLFLWLKFNSKCPWVEDVHQPWTSLLDQRSRSKNLLCKICLNF